MRLRSRKILSGENLVENMNSSTTTNASEDVNIPVTNIGGTNVSTSSTENNVVGNSSTIGPNTIPEMRTAISQVLPYSIPPLNNTSTNAPLYGMPPGWNTSSSLLPTPPTFANTTTITPLGQTLGNIVGNIDNASTSTFRQNVLSNPPQVGSNGNTDIPLTHDSLRQIIQESNRTTANILAQHLGAILTPMAQQVSNLVNSSPNSQVQPQMTGFNTGPLNDFSRNISQSPLGPAHTTITNPNLGNFAGGNQPPNGLNNVPLNIGQNSAVLQNQGFDLFANIPNQIGTGGGNQTTLLLISKINLELFTLIQIHLISNIIKIINNKLEI